VGEILPLKKVGKGFFVQIFLIGEIWSLVFRNLQS
jgi:hypothetical protein